MSEPIYIQNARIITMNGPVIPNGELLIHEGKIAAVGPRVEHRLTARAAVVDARGMTLCPGFIDAHCHLGMFNDGMGFEGADGNEDTDPVTPQLRALDGFNPFDRCIQEARENGVTLAVTGPGSANVIGGQFMAVKTAGRCAEEMVVRAPLAMKVAFGENPKRVYHDQQKTPSTRMATAALLREHLVGAQEYMRKMEIAKQDPEKQPDRDLKMEALCQVLLGEIPLKAHAHRADDILTALRIAEEFNVGITIDHCTEGHQIAPLLAERKAKVILGPLICERSKIELRNLSFKAPALMAQAGIEFAMMTDHPVIPIQFLPVCAAIAVREGLDEYMALASITLNAARILGLADRVGSLEAGKDADIVMLDGAPLDVRSHVCRVYIDGRQVYDKPSV